MTRDIIIIADYTEDVTLTVVELCEICKIEQGIISEYISYDILRPHGELPEEWVFDMTELKRLRTAQRLQHDLELNFAGVALVLDLLEELDSLRAQSDILKKHLL